MPKRHYIREVPRRNGAGSTFVDADPADIVAAKARRRLRRKLCAAQDKADRALKAFYSEPCEHRVVYDVAGWVYDQRVCVACGHISLL